ncbi:MAG: hypothetical protein U0796_16955 [Gemmatales bacterium]
MRSTLVLGLASIAGSLLLQASMATETTAQPSRHCVADAIAPDNINSWADAGYVVAHASDSSAAEQAAGIRILTRLRALDQGVAPAANTFPPDEAMELLGAIKARIGTQLLRGNEHSSFSMPIPTTLDGFEKLFWDLHVVSNQLTNATRLFDYSQQLQPIARKYIPRKSDQLDTSALTGWDKVKAEIVALNSKLVERNREMRVARVMLADKVLTERPDALSTLQAALALDMDAEVLPALLARDTTFPTSRVADLNATIHHARTIAGPDIIRKARLLFTGLHWWERGRYGAGSAGQGLLKDPAALRSPDVMFGLMMPIGLSSSTGPSPAPLVDRRHHYLWQFETRQILSGATSQTHRSVEHIPVEQQVTTLSHFY